MKLLSVLFLVAFAAASAKAETTAIINARAVTMTAAGTIDGATIIISEGRIDAVGEGLTVPAGARTIDASGRPVTPALMNSGSQLGLIELGSARDTDDSSAGESGLGASFDVQYALNLNSVLIRVALADGLARAVVLPLGTDQAPFLGIGALLHLQTPAAVLGQHGLAAMVRIGGAASGGPEQSRAAHWQLLRNSLEDARVYAADPGKYAMAGNRRSLAALVPVVEGRMPLVIHTLRESDIRQAVALADDHGLRVIIYGGNEAWRVADLLATKRIPVVLDPSANQPATFDTVGTRADNAAILERGGVTIAFVASRLGQNYNTAASMREGAGLAVANGLSWEAALAAITRNPARIWGIAETFGTLEPGRDADIVIWDGDPLEVMSAPAVVLIAGVPVSLATRQILLRDRYAPDHDAELPPAYR